MKFEYNERNVLIPKYDTYDTEYEEGKAGANINIDLADQRQAPHVKFCCTIDLPPHFDIAPEHRPRFIYNTDCLSTNVISQQICCETNCGPVLGTCFIAKITGCIPYLISIAVRTGCGGEVNLDLGQCNVKTNDDKIGYICCKGSICVDEVIGQSTQTLNLPKLGCDNVFLKTFNIVPGTDVTVCNEKLDCTSLVAGGTIELPLANPITTPCPPGLDQTHCQ